jgi:putative peptidoglycan lipid II flippase
MTRETTATAATTFGVGRSATLLSLGNLASRLLGLIREMVITAYFGASGQVSAFRVASQVVTSLYDFLIGGMLSAALVPTLTEYWHQRRPEFVALLNILVSLTATVLAGLVVIVVVFAPTLAELLAPGWAASDPTLLPLTVTLIRLVAPAIWLFSLAGLLMAVLYAQQRFTFPALATAVYNLGLVVAVPLLAGRISTTSLAVGILLGSLAQILLLGWDLRRTGWRWQWQWAWRHPAVGKILRLYLPNAGVLLVSLFQVGLDRRLASGTGEQSIAWMANATTLQQLPLGLISVAIALAALPRLSQYYAARAEAAYQATLERGLTLVLLLLAPAAVGLWLLGVPVTRLIFERGQFTAQDTLAVVSALHIYLIGMLFAAIDFPLNYAFYARNNTWLPALVGVFSIAVYSVVALGAVGRLGFLGLVWADTAKQASHACVMLGLLLWQMGWFSREFLPRVGQIGLGAAAMAAMMTIVSRQSGLGDSATAWADLRQVLVSGGLGLFTYLLTLQLLGVGEVRQLRDWLQKTGRAKFTIGRN